ncbi:MAG: hypothetical protein WD690_16485 [Vicinamibacterales bacterium]
MLAVAPPTGQAAAPPVQTVAEPSARPTVFLRDDRGVEIRGKLLRLDMREAVLLVGDQERRFDLAKVRRIEKRGDSLKNGALIGAAFGLLGGLLIGALGTCEPPPGVVTNCEDASPIAIGVVGGLLYGAVGAGIDALIRGRTVLYQAPTITHRTPIKPTFITLRVGW